MIGDSEAETQPETPGRTTKCQNSNMLSLGMLQHEMTKMGAYESEINEQSGA